MISDKFQRNNLDKANSPYLLQHAQNPVWWQEWSREVLEEARRRDVPVFVSSGYATCHWCHVMASEAFSDTATADLLNRDFICVKVDREERPDIDHYLMEFIQSRSGRGGWPLNAFLTPRMEPFLAFTYLPVESGHGMPGLLHVASHVREHYRERKGFLAERFEPSRELPEAAAREEVLEGLQRMFDRHYGGFGREQKFPPHCTLVFLLDFLQLEDDTDVRLICSRTLDAMCLGGLNDHLQGGIFRYCVDREWQIPHFEKMLYDQAMTLWCYSLAYRVFGHERYRDMAGSIIRCLRECFSRGSMFLSALDADTGHEEGATYLWGYGELEEILGHEGLEAMAEVYDVSQEGNFEGKNHLVRFSHKKLPELEEKLLKARLEREQPEADTKILCGINALVAIGLLQAGKCLESGGDYTEEAVSLVESILTTFWDGKRLAHCLSGGILQERSFLFDAAALLAAVAMIAGEDPAWFGTLDELKGYIQTFRDGDGWLESRPEDFHHVPAPVFDHPTPSSTSMALFALASADLVLGRKPERTPFRQPFSADFFNVVALMSSK